MLLYNVKKEEMRIGKHKGKTMYYASPIAQDKITTKQLEDRIVNATALSLSLIHIYVHDAHKEHSCVHAHCHHYHM